MKLPFDPRRSDLWIIGLSFSVLFLVCGIFALAYWKASYWEQVGIGLTYSTLILFISWLVLYIFVPEFYSKEKEEMRLTEILSLVRDELTHNIKVCEGDPRVWVLPGCRDEFWKAITHSGDIQFIKDLSLLYLISEAYHLIGFRLIVEQLIKQAHYYPGGIFGEPEKGLYGLLDKSQERTLAKLREVVRRINDVLGAEVDEADRTDSQKTDGTNA